MCRMKFLLNKKLNKGIHIRLLEPRSYYCLNAELNALIAVILITFLIIFDYRTLDAPDGHHAHEIEWKNFVRRRDRDCSRRHDE